MLMGPLESPMNLLPTSPKGYLPFAFISSFVSLVPTCSRTTDRDLSMSPTTSSTTCLNTCSACSLLLMILSSTWKQPVFSVGYSLALLMMCIASFPSWSCPIMFSYFSVFCLAFSTLLGVCSSPMLVSSLRFPPNFSSMFLDL